MARHKELQSIQESVSGSRSSWNDANHARAVERRANECAQAEASGFVPCVSSRAGCGLRARAGA